MYPNSFDWDLHIRRLLLALEGSISPNFRMISLSFIEGAWLVEFILEKNNVSDLEEIDEIIFDYIYGIENTLPDWPRYNDYQFSDLVSSLIKSKITVNLNPISYEAKDRYIVLFRRKEII